MGIATSVVSVVRGGRYRLHDVNWAALFVPLRKLNRNHSELRVPKFWSMRPVNALALFVPTEFKMVLDPPIVVGVKLGVSL